MNNEDLLTELRWALDNIGASRDYFRIGNALESAIKALTPSATAAPVAWLIKYDAAPNTGQMQQITHGHNAIGDYRQIDPAATSTPLYSAPQSLQVEETAPDWAQQLPGAEIFDRAARYEYIRTLNPRKFAALYNEALMGVHQFDDLVDRYRMEARPVDHGYDRSASLNAGHYVCTCGGACSRPDAKEPSK